MDFNDKKTKEDFFGQPSGIFPDGTKIKTKQDREHRRSMIMEDRFSGMTIAAIGKKYKISPQTVAKDIKKFKKISRRKMLKTNKDSLTGEVLFWWDSMFRKAKDTFDEAEKPLEKNALINTMSKIVKHRIEFLFDSGILNKINKNDNNSDLHLIEGIDIGKADLNVLLDLIERKSNNIKKLKNQAKI